MKEVKTCRQCGLEKPADAGHFRRWTDRQGRPRIGSPCRDCLADYAAKQRRLRNVPIRRKGRDKDRANLMSAIWKLRNSEKVKIYVARYREKNKDRIREFRKKYYNNRDKDRTNLLARQRRLSRPDVRVRRTISSAITSSLKRYSKQQGRRPRWEALTGYSVDDLRRHLERQFKKGMTWDNIGKGGWHIDHIIPVASFKIETAGDPEFRACWALSNLRPLWAIENQRKHAKRLHLL